MVDWGKKREFATESEVMNQAVSGQKPQISAAPRRKAGIGRRWWIIAVILILVGAGGYAAYTYYASTQQAAAEESQPYQTTTARSDDLTVYASGTGSIVPASEIAIGFQDSGTLSEILVQVGEQVSAGQVLARLQTNNTQESIDASIASAELSVLTAQQALDKLYNQADTERATAMQAVAAYSETVKDAQYQLDNFTIPTNQAGMSAMEAVVALGARLDEARAAFEPYRYLDAANPTRQDLLEALSQAQANYNAAIKRLDYEYQLEVAKINLQQAIQDYEKLKDGPNPDDLAAAQAQLKVAEAQLALTKQDQPVVELVAPVDGTVLSIESAVGESPGSAAFITLADLSRPVLKVYLDESDLSKVAVGNEVEVVFDSLPDTTYTGKVIQVNPSLVSVSNVSAVEALVQLDSAQPENLDNLPIGLNAAVDVISGRAVNAILVPVEALREIAPGEYAVFVIENGQPRLRAVTVGLQDVTSAEIISGLQPGEIISTGLVETQ
jgi:multidrug efflux pump subunit AcrA (membrane-fusion protein)